MQFFHLLDFTLRVSTRILFHIEKLTLETGDKVALVGANGSGKTTLLKALLGEHRDYGGRLRRAGLVACFRQRSDERPELYDPEQISRWQLSQLVRRETEAFSGGEEVRMRLAEVFASPHDFLMLDEPGTHLDAGGLEELKRQLRREDSYLIVSHDRELLEEFCPRSLVIQDGKLTDFPGTYSAYREWEKAEFEGKVHEAEVLLEERKRLSRVLEKQKQSAARMERKPKNLSSSEQKAIAFAALRKPDAKAKHMMSAAKNTEKRIERMGEIHVPKRQYVIKPDFQLTDPPQNKLIVEAHEFTFSYPGQEPLFVDADFALKRNVRTALVGENGSGKSTFLKLIRGGHPDIRVVPKARFGVFDQKFEAIDPSKTILENIRQSSCQNESVNRNVLARMGFFQQEISKTAGILSGGELTRLSFAMLFVSDCNVLLIDEPGNYLDIPSYEAIEGLLRDYEGSMLFCTHDRHFLTQVAEEVWEIRERKLRPLR